METFRVSGKRTRSRVYPRLVFLRLVPYDAGDSAISIRLFLAAGSKTTRTRARKTLATRRSMLKE